MMGESLNVASDAMQTGMELAAGSFAFKIATDNVELARELGDVAVRVIQESGKVAVKLGAIYAGYNLLKPIIKAAITNAFGGQRDDQDVGEPKPGSLRVLLRCFTDKRFLEVLADYESGGVKQRLQKELADAGLKVEGLKVEIENMEEVNKRKTEIKER